jgi:hypothetical protein
MIVEKKYNTSDKAGEAHFGSTRSCIEFSALIQPMSVIMLVIEKIKIEAKIKVRLALIAVLSLVGSILAQPIPTPSPSPSAKALTAPAKSSSPTPEQLDEERLLKARIANEDAQAQYYRKLKENLDQPPSAKSFRQRLWQSIAENPVSTFGVLGALIALIGAFIAARVAFLSFFFNYHAALKNQTDSQFYEGLKRFGDKDSPAIRASAAGMLAVMGQMEVSRFEQKEPAFLRRVSLSRVVDRPYLSLAVDQLLSGLMLEQNVTVLSAIKSALQRLIPLDREGAKDGLYRVNLLLQENLISALAEFFAARGFTQLAGISEIDWNTAGVSTALKTAELRKLVGRFETNRGRFLGKEKRWIPPKEFTSCLQKARKVVETLKDDKISEHIARVFGGLEIAGDKMHINTDLLLIALSNADLSQAGLDDAFLAGREIVETHKVDLDSAKNLS